MPLRPPVPIGWASASRSTSPTWPFNLASDESEIITGQILSVDQRRNDILVQSGCADKIELAASERRLEHVGNVETAFAAALSGTDDRLDSSMNRICWS
jgi:hypothetical protein